jgi:general secretion pathway protein C
LNWKGYLEWLQQPAVLGRFVTSTNLLLVLALAYTLSRLFWQLMPPVEQTPMPASVPEAGVAATPVRSAAVGRDLNQLHLFGQVQVAVAPVRPPPEQVPETTLKLDLKGILASSDPAFARAIIADPSRKEDFYGIDDKLPGGAVVKEIHSDRIILSRNGRLETLKLPKELLDSASAVQAPDDERPGRQVASAGPRQLGSGSSLSDFRDALMKDPQTLMGLLRAEPVTDAGRITGYKLGESQDPQMLRRFGLRRGDVVTSVNGIKLDGPTKMPELLKILPTADELKIEYERLGRPRSIVLNMN